MCCLSVNIYLCACFYVYMSVLHLAAYLCLHACAHAHMTSTYPCPCTPGPRWSLLTSPQSRLSPGPLADTLDARVPVSPWISRSQVLGLHRYQQLWPGSGTGSAHSWAPVTLPLQAPFPTLAIWPSRPSCLCAFVLGRCGTHWTLTP